MFDPRLTASEDQSKEGRHQQRGIESSKPNALGATDSTENLLPSQHIAHVVIRAGDEACARGDISGGLRYFLEAVEKCPQLSLAHQRAGVAWWLLGNREQARRHYEQALQLDPKNADVHHGLAEINFDAARSEAALHHARNAVELAPDNPEIALTLGYLLEADRQTGAAMEIVQKMMDRGHASARLATLYARIGPSIGRTDDALARVEGLLGSGRVQFPHERSSLHFAATNLLDRLGRYDQAFAQARLAHEARNVQYDPQSIERLVNEKIELFSRQTLRCMPRASESSDKPVFIVGMPRSGTSLVEQVLASHPMVHGAGELNWIGQIKQSVLHRAPEKRRQTLDLRQCSLTTINEMAGQYLRPLIALNPQARRITDKLPLNFLNLGLIAVLFPEARVIHCVRDPLDTCLSCYLTELNVGTEFTASLAALGHFYNQYRRLMDHWKQVLDYSILDVSYEAMVEDLESNARRVLEFLRLPWDARCLSFHENRRLVATASNSQVRQPLYRSSVGRWKNYERRLTPLRSALGWG
ncbi:MAG TPA: sulfotransferase [Tepidisphaeraceae bacterium]|nr:sulfotransferase [Tepidisphaeraceae bacterium]